MTTSKWYGRAPCHCFLIETNAHTLPTKPQNVNIPNKTLLLTARHPKEMMMTTRNTDEVNVGEASVNEGNGEDPYLTMLEEVLTRLGDIERSVEELGEKISDIGLNVGIPERYDS